MRFQYFVDVEDLWSEVSRLWEEFITPEFVRNIYRSMPRRIDAVIEANGKHTKY